MQEQERQAKSIFYYIFKFAGENKRHYYKSIFLALLGVIFSLLPYLVMANIVKMLLSGEQNFARYLAKMLVIGVCWILRTSFHTMSTRTSHIATFKLIGKLRAALCDKLSRLPLGTVLSMPSGAMKNIIVERVDSTETTMAHVVPEFTSNLAAPLLMFIYLLTIDWRIALLSLATFLVGPPCLMMMLKDYQVNFQRTQDTTKHLNEVAVEYIGGIEVIKAFGKTETSYKRFADAAKDNAYSFIDWMRPNLLPHALMMTVMPCTLLAVLPVGAIFVMNGSLSLANFLTALLVSMSLITPLITVVSYQDDIRKASFIFAEIEEILELPELLRPEISKINPSDASISLSDVRFAYKDKEVLHGINLKIPAGKTTALVGPSGSGKSTIARLIASLWDVNEGSIKIGTTDIRDMSLEEYNSKIAYVSQDTFLFDTTVRENIRIGKPDASDEEVEAIAKASGCFDFIMQLENGFNTRVGSSGAHLSGGEMQRISIARAMMKNAPILILDEATAYADPENEAIIQQSVAKLAKDKTLIVIAHRLSTITDADQIAVINSGNIEGLGTHKELLQRCELYKNMWNAHIDTKDKDENLNVKGGKQA